MTWNITSMPSERNKVVHIAKSRKGCAGLWGMKNVSQRSIAWGKALKNEWLPWGERGEKSYSRSRQMHIFRTEEYCI